GVLQALALGQRRAAGAEVDHVGAEALGGQLERDAGAGGVLEEQVADGPAAQGGDLLDRAVGDLRQVPGGVQHPADVEGAEVRRGQQVLVHPTRSSRVRMWTPSAPSMSAPATWTSSSMLVR